MPEADMTAADDTPQWQAQQTSPLAIVSMVCGMVALVLGPLAILAIVFGHIARGQISRTGEGGRGMATAGLILGYVVLVAGTALVVAFLASLPNFGRGFSSSKCLAALAREADCGGRGRRPLPPACSKPRSD
jgi:hypothetical protein